jgi:hypothetical protein
VLVFSPKLDICRSRLSFSTDQNKIRSESREKRTGHCALMNSASERSLKSQPAQPPTPNHQTLGSVCPPPSRVLGHSSRFHIAELTGGITRRPIAPDSQSGSGRRRAGCLVWSRVRPLGPVVCSTKERLRDQQAVRRLQRKGSKKQMVTKPETLEFAKCVIVFTTRSCSSTADVLKSYRLRLKSSGVYAIEEPCPNGTRSQA